MMAGQNTNMMQGAIWACILPMGLGVLGLLYSLNSIAPFQGWIILPIVVCFIFGTPLTAWLSCRRLSKIEDAGRLSRWPTSASVGVYYAGLIHLVSAFMYTLVFAIASIGLTESGGVYIGNIGEVMMVSAMINLPLYIIVTLPLSIVCATIFWTTTDFPKGTAVF